VHLGTGLQKGEKNLNNEKNCFVLIKYNFPSMTAHVHDSFHCILYPDLINKTHRYTFIRLQPTTKKDLSLKD